MMTKTLLNLVVVLTLMTVGLDAGAQSAIAQATRSDQLQKLSDKLEQRDQADRQEARDFARRLGIQGRRELAHGRVLELQRIAPGIGPVFYITNNVDAADSVSTDEVWPGGSAGLNLDGSGMTVGEWDGGAIFSAHPDFTGRLSQVDGATAVSGHSTHVAGTLIGAGEWLDPRSRGMAYAAHLDAYDWNSDTAEMASAAAGGLLISNHSYGVAAGWLYIGDVAPDNWWWIGGSDPSDIEDRNFGYYDSESQLWDQIAFDAPYYLIVKAAGNDRTDIGASPGEEYTVIDQDGNFLFTSTLPRQPDCAPAGYDCLPTHSVAKNILTVGAVDDVPGGYSPFSGPSAVQMASFSSWGPTDDGRIKPDLVGNGMFLISAWPDNPYYAAAAGTSMATPNVTGSLLLVQEHYQDIHGPGNFMRAATLKALAIHTADEAGDDDGPDYEFGWGLLNTKSAVQLISSTGPNHQVIEDTLSNGATQVVEVSTGESDARVTATLVWADPPGTPVAPALDPTDLMLVNDLDLRITHGATTYMPWVLNPGNPAAAATTGDNYRDNVEQVRADGGGAGSYFIEVSHKGTLLDGNSQAYSLIISVTTAPPTTSSLLIDEDFSGVTLPNADWFVDTNSGVSWTIGPFGGSPHPDNLTGGSGEFAIVDPHFNSITRSSLRTVPFDLSTAEAVVLRFNSYLYYDFFETLNVDVSTNGGGSWLNVWTFSGFNPFPTLYTLDLTGVAAGQPSATFRFRFDSLGEIQGDVWQIDDVELEAFGGEPSEDPPAAASNPDPADGTSGMGLETFLTWSAGSLATSHDVYLDGVFQGNQTGTTFAPASLEYGTSYNWRIDEVNEFGTTIGSAWSFSTAAASVLPGLAGNPTPADGANDIGIDDNLSWTAGTDATSHDVWFNGVFQGNQSGLGFDPGTLAYSSTYTWRIDEVNSTGTTTGTLWSFETGSAPTSPGFRVVAVSVEIVNDKGPRNKGVATITVTDGDSSPVAGVVIDGLFSGDWSGSRSGTTDSSGQVVLETPPVKNGSAWQFCVVSASKAGWVFDQGGSTGLCGAPPPLGAVSGIVTDAATTLPISGASVGADTGQSDTTDASGLYSLADVPVGSRMVTVSADGYDSASSPVSVSDAATTTQDFALTAATGGGFGTVKGVVSSDTGDLLEGATVHVSGGPSATTNKRGKYSIRDVAAGMLTVTASLPGFADSTTQVTLTAGSTVTLDFTLSPN